jgi:iron(III) transport system substrate-binding protein
MVGLPVQLLFFKMGGNIMKGKLVTSMWVALCLLTFLGISAAAENKLAPSITVYMGMSPVGNGEAAEYIKQKTGVEIKQTFMSYGEIGAKMKAEAPNFSADMCIGIGMPQAFAAKKEGWSVPYDSPTWRGAKELYKDPDNNYFNLGVDALAWVVNTKILSEKGYKAPNSWDEMLDPKWKGQIVMPSPMTSGNGYKILYAFMQLYGFNAGKGESGGWQFLEALDKQIHHYTRSGAAPLELVSKGEFMMGIGDNSVLADMIKQGHPIELLAPKEGTGGDGIYAAILKGTKNEYTCQKIIDFLGTKEFSEWFGPSHNAATKEPDISLPLYQGKPGYPDGKPVYIPNLKLAWAAENRDRLTQEWKAKFLVQGREAK